MNLIRFLVTRASKVLSLFRSITSFYFKNFYFSNSEEIYLIKYINTTLMQNNEDDFDDVNNNNNNNTVLLLY